MASDFQRRGHPTLRYGYKPDLRHLLGVPEVKQAKHLEALAVPTTNGGLDEAAVRSLGILDQGGSPYCVSHGWAGALRDCQQRNGLASPRLASRLWLMFGAHAYEGDISGFDGAMVGDAARWIEAMGFPPEETMPFSDANPNASMRQPPAEAPREAFDRKEPLSYSRIMEAGDARVTRVMQALAWGGVGGRPCPVVFGGNVTNAYASGNLGPGFVVGAPDPDDIDGGHCQRWIRFEFDPGVEGGVKFRCVNSWGDDWADDGMCWMTPAYLKDPGTSDIWICDYQGVQP